MPPSRGNRRSRTTAQLKIKPEYSERLQQHPFRQASLLAIMVNVELPAVIEMNGTNVHPSPNSVVDLRSHVQHDDEQDRDIVKKEGLCVGVAIEWLDGKVELHNDENDAHDQAETCSVGPGPWIPWQVAGAAALGLPRSPEAEMGQANHASAEQSEEKRQVGEPAEDLFATVADVDVRKATSKEQC
jgi:hypothetical protein